MEERRIKEEEEKKIMEPQTKNRAKLAQFQFKVEELPETINSQYPNTEIDRNLRKIWSPT